ncbi:MAG: branched-chain amino acid ABC transporter permease [Alphaproteobacteria bacterium]|nr:branched-chain amino acid ABC transporter permease [Alphaproteobacteria bacterium]
MSGKFPTAPVVAVTAALVAAALPFLGPSEYALYLMSLSVAFAIIASGLNITNGYLGLLNLAAAGEVGLGAYGCVLGLKFGLPMIGALLAAVALGAVAAAFIFIIFARLQGFFFGLATLAAAEAIRLMLRNFDGLTNGVRGLRGYPQLASTPEMTYWILLATLASIVAGIWILMRSPVGLRWRAIRENRVKAAAVGIRVARNQFIGFVVSGAIMALGGAFLSLLLQYIEPGVAALSTLVQIVLMVALGGPGTVMGPIIGAVIIALIPELLRVANELRLVMYGLALIAIVLAMPGGILGVLERTARSRRLQRAGNDRKE